MPLEVLKVVSDSIPITLAERSSKIVLTLPLGLVMMSLTDARLILVVLGC
jgi:hypothetical protein